MIDGVNLVFFEGEDPEALKQEFIRLCAKHKHSQTPMAIAKYVFRDLREPILRAMQAAAYWGDDIAVLEAIDHLILYGAEGDVADLIKRQKIAMVIAEDTKEAAKDRIAALEYVSKTKGEIKRLMDIDVGDKAGKPLTMFRVVERQRAENA